MVYTVAFPGPGGEWGAMGIFLAYAVDLPIGLLALIVALAVRHGSRRLRTLCLVAAIVTICLPLLAGGIQRYHTRWKYGVADDAAHPAPPRPPPQQAGAVGTAANRRGSLDFHAEL